MNGCVSGGRYCIFDSDFFTEEIVIETLRQICIRKEYKNADLIDYLILTQNTIAEQKQNKDFVERTQL